MRGCRAWRSRLLAPSLCLPRCWPRRRAERWKGCCKPCRKLSSAAGGGQAGAEAPAFHADMRIGQYRLVREIGHGGMGKVWLAMRMDELVTRPVALKLPHLHLQSAVFADRFARERDFLANLTHPNIAHLYDAGISSQGQPYLVMEFVAGESLTQYCRARQATLRERLGLFLQVLSAVHYAHTQNIIHRDLKPSNILVRESAQVVLLDFGIAKLLIEGEADATELTRHGGAAFTPDYASPEQIKGETLGPATDIYSLGVVLFELLTGQRPYELSARRAGSSKRQSSRPILAGRAIRSPKYANSLRPNGRPQIQRKELRGDLDSIVLKAMKKQPRDRYPSADAFAEDLRRHLRHDAVSAQPATLWYRATRLAQRHRSALVTAAVAVTLSAAAGTLAVRNGLIPTHRLGPDSRPAFSPPPHSIAVLPFENLSGDPTQEYFSDGITDELINSLSQLNQLKVVARTSSFSFKGQNADISTIAHKLNVGTIMDGSVRRAGKTVRITVQLIDAVSGFHIWSETYDRTLNDTLKIQTEVATSVAEKLKLNISGYGHEQLAAGRTGNADAYDAYLRGVQLIERAHLEQSTAIARSSLSEFDRAISMDPEFAQAYARKADALIWLALWENDQNTRETGRARALKSAQRAVALAPTLAEAHLSLGRALLHANFDIAGAAPEFNRVLMLAPGSARVQAEFADYAAVIGQFDSAVRAAQRAVILDPRNISAHLSLVGTLTDARRFDEAAVALRAASALGPISKAVAGAKANLLLASGQVGSAVEHCEWRDTPLDEWQRSACLALAYHASGRQGDAERELKEFQSLSGDSSAVNYAGTYAQWGNLPEAIKWLNTAERLRTPELMWLKVRWEFDPIRNDPKFQAIVARLKIP